MGFHLQIYGFCMSQTPLLQISVLIIQHFTIDKLYNQRKYEQGKESSSHQTSNDDYGQRALRLRTDAMAYGCRHQTDGGHRSRHDHRTDTGTHTFFHGTR